MFIFNAGKEDKTRLISYHTAVGDLGTRYKLLLVPRVLDLLDLPRGGGRGRKAKPLGGN